MTLDVAVKQSGPVTILEITGRLMLGAEVDHLRKCVYQCFEEGHKWLLLDLGGVQGSDSAGVGELVSIYASIARRGGALKFYQPSRKLKEMFHVTRLESLFECYDDEQEALASFEKNSAARGAAALSSFLE